MARKDPIQERIEKEDARARLGKQVFVFLIICVLFGCYWWVTRRQERPPRTRQKAAVVRTTFTEDEWTEDGERIERDTTVLKQTNTVRIRKSPRALRLEEEQRYANVDENEPAVDNGDDVIGE